MLCANNQQSNTKRLGERFVHKWPKRGGQMSKHVIAAVCAIAISILVACYVQNGAVTDTPENSNGDVAEKQLGTDSKYVNFTDESDAANWEQVTPKIAVMGRTMKELDTANTTPAAQRYEYEVLIKLRNDGDDPVVFDSVLLSFVPSEGKPFEMVTTSRDLKDQRKILTKTLKRGEVEDWSTGSDGYTDEIVSRSNEKPIGFEITLRLKGKTVEGPFRAEMPNLNDLPLAKEQEPQQPAIYLKFKGK